MAFTEGQKMFRTMLLTLIIKPDAFGVDVCGWPPPTIPLMLVMFPASLKAVRCYFGQKHISQYTFHQEIITAHKSLQWSPQRQNYQLFGWISLDRLVFCDRVQLPVWVKKAYTYKRIYSYIAMEDWWAIVGNFYWTSGIKTYAFLKQTVENDAN